MQTTSTGHFVKNTLDSAPLVPTTLVVGAMGCVIPTSRGASKVKQYTLTNSLKNWQEYNGDLEDSEHIRAIVWHSKRVGKLEAEFVFYDDPGIGFDLVQGEFEPEKATPAQIALAKQQQIVSDSIEYHSLCIRLHTQRVTKVGTYREPKDCALRFADSALHKIIQEEQAR